MTRLALLPAIGISLAILVSACGVSVEDAGPHTVERRQVGSFERIEVSGSTEVVVRPGRSGTLTVEGGRNRVRDLETRVESGTLVVAGRDSSGTIDVGDGDVEVVVHAPALAGIHIDGSGSVSAPRMGGEAVAVSVDGSGEVEAGGTAGHLDASVDGSGDLDLSRLAADSAAVEIRGSGGAEVDAESRLDAEIHGSGEISYAGAPRLDEDVSGSGSVDAG